MKVRIGPMELSDITEGDFDTIEALVRRFGDVVPPPASPENHQTHHEHAKRHPAPSMGASSHQDAVLLRRFIEVGSGGLEAKEVGELLGKKGKAIRTGIRDWAARLKLASEGQDAFEVKRVGTKRGFRIKDALLEVAKSIAAGMK